MKNNAKELAKLNGDVVEVVMGESLGVLEKAQVDAQITTAKTYPRSITRFFEQAKMLATTNPAIAELCTYAVPRAGGVITGPSVRLAEIAASAWQNLRFGGRIIGINKTTVTAQGVCHDLENNIAVQVEVQRGIVTHTGARYGADMIRVTCQAAIAIAIRNAIFKIIPSSFVAEIQAEAQKVARGEAGGLEKRADKLISRLKELNISEERIYQRLGVAGKKDIAWDHVDLLIALGTSLNTGEATGEELFPRKAESPKEGKMGLGKREENPPSDSELRAKAEAAKAQQEVLEREKAATEGAGADGGTPVPGEEETGI